MGSDPPRCSTLPNPVPTLPESPDAAGRLGLGSSLPLLLLNCSGVGAGRWAAPAAGCWCGGSGGLPAAGGWATWGSGGGCWPADSWPAACMLPAAGNSAPAGAVGAATGDAGGST